MPMRFYILWLLFAVVGRIIPHPPNITPFTNLSLIAGTKLNLLNANILVLLGLFISDMMLAWLYGYPLFGYWTLFGYSGFLFCTWVGKKFSNMPSLKNWLLLLATLSVGYWLWTNLGVWLLSGFYAHTWEGLWFCYYMALPFLRNALIGDLGWFLIIYFAYKWSRVPVYCKGTLTCT